MKNLVLRKSNGTCYVVDTDKQVIVYYDKCIIKCLDWMNRASLAFDIAKNIPTYH